MPRSARVAGIFAKEFTMIAAISPRDLSEMKKRGEPVELIDVRTPAEFQEVHVDFARNIPLDRLDPRSLSEYREANAKSLYVICRSGGRSRMACEKLSSAGLSVVNVDGGTQAWDEAGLAVVRGRKTVSLERQVRIAAGSLVLLGAALGYFVHPYWIGLSGFVGAGLIFAGVTDTCGMGMILARMPWNR